jgi:hypothetical protein
VRLTAHAPPVWLWDSRSTRFSERSREGTPEVRACRVILGDRAKWRTHRQIDAASRRLEAFQRLANGETQADIARTYAVHPATIGRMLGTTGSPFGGASVAVT